MSPKPERTLTPVAEQYETMVGCHWLLVSQCFLTEASNAHHAGMSQNCGGSAKSFGKSRSIAEPS